MIIKQKMTVIQDTILFCFSKSGNSWTFGIYVQFKMNLFLAAGLVSYLFARSEEKHFDQVKSKSELLDGVFAFMIPMLSKCNRLL